MLQHSSCHLNPSAKEFAPLLQNLDGNDREFGSRIFSKGIEVYRHRLEGYGFTGHEKVMDAGCGLGQWSIALAQLNKLVWAIDFSQQRINFLAEAVNSFNIPNIFACQGKLENVSFLDDASLDAIFCYQAVFLTDWKKTLNEFARLLRPGGRLFVNSNGIGWYKFLWLDAHNASAVYDPQMVTVRAFENTLNYKRGLPFIPGVDLIIGPEEMMEMLRELGMTALEIGGDARLAKGTNHTPFFQETYYGDTGIYEILAIKG